MLCPFLSTNGEKVECFKECAFLKYEAEGEQCPFRNLVNSKKCKVFYDDSYIEDELEEHKRYLQEIYSENYTVSE